MKDEEKVNENIQEKAIKMFVVCPLCRGLPACSFFVILFEVLYSL